jgi:hypothetical protein
MKKIKNKIMNTQNFLSERGLSKLDNSDVFVGSYFSKEDVKTILSVNKMNKKIDDIKLKEIVPTKWKNNNYILQEDLSKQWKSLKETDKWKELYYPKASIDEYILVALIKNTYPSASVEQQKCIKFSSGKRRWMYIDICLELHNKKFFIEFHGPYRHFIGENLENPFDRKKQIEKEFPDARYIIWPYWIQKCIRNLKNAIGESEENGFGALWGTDLLFNLFAFDNAADIIKEITAQFNAAPDNDFGYFYEGNSCGRQMPEHPIIEKILKGERDVNDLIPKTGVNMQNQEEIDLWLPTKLKGK